MIGRFKAWRECKRLARWERLGIPTDVRERAEKAGLRDAPDWYAGRSTQTTGDEGGHS